MGKFKSAVHQFTLDAKNDTSLVFRSAADKLVKEVIKPKSSGGFLPHETGNLGRSLSASTTEMPQLDKNEADYTASNSSFVISGLDAGDTLFLGFQASYAARQNFGFVGDDKLGRTYNQAGNLFVENAGEKWPSLVAQAERELGSGK